MTPLLSWYGDDFTGAAAVLEVLAFAGIPAALFLTPPAPHQAHRFGGLRAVGLAGDARARGPEWMDRNLPAVFDWLHDTGADIALYKVCSTLDSSPTTGSIGRAIEIGQSRFGSSWVPVLVAAPEMRRYQCFGNLFAGAPETVYRLDRHPVMARHPVTPMHEADVLRHLARQTGLHSGLIDLAALAEDGQAEHDLREALRDGAEIISLDALTKDHMPRIGRLIWENRTAPQLAVGSQGVAYALVAHWIATGIIPAPPAPPRLPPADRILAVSGSVSPVTAAQIDHATGNGFAGIALDAAAIARGGPAADAAIAATHKAALATFEAGHSPLIFTARGPDDPAVRDYRRAVADTGLTADDANRRLGVTLGRLLRGLIAATGAGRVVISGGDSSSFAAQELDIFALQAVAPTSPGVAVFRAASDDPGIDGLEITLKGGQMGRESCFCDLRDGPCV
ncbi:four-carbon acid sugar kinase family protein [Rhodobacteraceae bacterium CCMM004]|nr:four-carbon acid sugar kinase family protein [Rhodobacteraceae bacterium CCMM004]